MGVKIAKFNAQNQICWSNTGVCFGFTASSRGMSWTDCTHVGYSLSHDTIWENSSFGGNNGVPVYNARDSIIEVANAIASLPHYAGMEVVEVDGDHWLKAPVTMPADQIITAFFLCRNIARSHNIMATYQWIASRGYPAAVALIMTQLAERREHVAEWESEAERWVRVHNRESSMIDVRNFGLRSLDRFVLGEQIPWYQQSWVTNHGYTRDSSFRNNEQFQGSINASQLDRVESSRHQRLMCTVMGMDDETPIMLGNNFDDDTMLFFLEESLPEDMAQGLAAAPTLRTLIEGLAPAGTGGVTMSETGRYRYANDAQNPHGMEGVIEQNFPNDLHCYQVRWANGNVNFYLREELQVSAEF